MKKMFMVSKATLVLLIGLALGTAFWVGSTSSVQAQNMSPTKMIESQLPHGKTSANAGKADYLAAVCEAVKKFRSAARAIVQTAVSTHPEWKNDILRSAFSCAGNDDCRLLGRILRGAIDGSPGDANGLTELATQLAPGCASSFGGGHGDEGEGVFGNPAGINLNPPPGTIGGGGGQGNIVAVCVNGQTQFVTPERAQQLINSGEATLGACQVTPSVNQ